MADKLHQAIALLRSGDRRRGARLLAEVLQAEPQNETAWLWMSAVVTTDQQRIECLRRVLDINPTNPAAKEAMAQLGARGGGLSAVEEAEVQPAAHIAPEPATEVWPAPAALPPLGVVGPGELEDEERRSGRAEEEAEVQPAVYVAPEPAAEDWEPEAESGEREVEAQTIASVAPELPLERAEPEVEAELQPSALHQEAGVEPPGESALVWLNPSSAASKVVVLYKDAVAAANPERATWRRLLAELGQGAPPRAMLGDEAVVVPLAGITLASADKDASFVTLRYKQDGGLVLKTLDFANVRERDDFFDALQARLGADFQRTVREFNALQALTVPAAALVVIVLAAVFCYRAAAGLALDTTPGMGDQPAPLGFLIPWLLGLVGPSGVIILAALLAVAVVLWMIARTKQPPALMLLSPAGQPAPGALVPGPVAAPEVEQESGSGESGIGESGIRDQEVEFAQAAAEEQVLEIEPDDEVGEAPVAPERAAAELPAGQEAPAPSTTQARRPTARRRRWLVLAILLAVALLLAALAATILRNRQAANSEAGAMALDLSHRGLTSLSLQDVPAAGLISVDLSGNQLSELPPEIGRLSNVQVLLIRNNQLSELPPEIGQLGKLEWLILANNRLTALPPEIGRLSNLEVLDVQGNQLRELPPEIGQLSNLRELNVQDNPLERLPAEVERLPKVKIHR